MKTIRLTLVMALATLALGACKHRKKSCCYGPKNPAVYTALPCYPPVGK